MPLTSGQNTSALAALQSIVGATSSQSLPVGEMAGIAAVETWVPLYFAPDATALTAATLATVRLPFAGTIIGWAANVATVSSSGIPTVDVRKNGTSVFSTLVTIDVNETSTATAAVPAVLKTDGTATFAADDAITVVGTVAGTGTAGLKLWLKVRRTS